MRFPIQVLSPHHDASQAQHFIARFFKHDFNYIHLKPKQGKQETSTVTEEDKESSARDAIEFGDLDECYNITEIFELGGLTENIKTYDRLYPGLPNDSDQMQNAILLEYSPENWQKALVFQFGSGIS